MIFSVDNKIFRELREEADILFIFYKFNKDMKNILLLSLSFEVLTNDLLREWAVLIFKTFV